MLKNSNMPNAVETIKLIVARDFKQYDQEINNEDCLMRQFKTALIQNGLQFNYLQESLQYMPQERKKIVPIVMDFFVRAETIKDRKQLLQWLHFKGVYEAVQMLLDEFWYNNLCGDTLYLWTVADTIYQIKCPYFICDYQNIVCTSQYGIARQMIVLLLGAIKSSDSVPTLVSLLPDNDITLHVITALGKIGDKRCLPRLEGYVNAENAIIRREAVKAISRIRKSSTC